MIKMKILQERTEIAKAINFGKYPVIVIDQSNVIEMGGEIVGYRGGKVRVPWDYHGETMYLEAQVNYWKDDNKLVIGCSGSVIKNGFSYSDLIEMAEYANAPILDKNQEFVLIVHNSLTNVAYNPMILKTKDYKDIHCMDVLVVEEKIKL